MHSWFAVSPVIHKQVKLNEIGIGHTGGAFVAAVGRFFATVAVAACLVG